MYQLKDDITFRDENILNNNYKKIYIKICTSFLECRFLIQISMTMEYRSPKLLFPQNPTLHLNLFFIKSVNPV